MESEPLRNFTSFRVGGAAELLVIPDDSLELEKAYRFLKGKGIPVTVVGGGSNVIAPDGGIEGVVLCTRSRKARVEFRENGMVGVDAGVPLDDFIRGAAHRGWGGLGALAGIPGTVGGALVMNAGTGEGNVSDRLENVRVLTGGDEVRVLDKSQLVFGYRTSTFRNTGWLILSADFQLIPSEREETLEEIDRVWKSRAEKFPLEWPSAGSVFKRPEGDYAGRLIEEAGCKGMRVGGARVSEKHGNFIVNDGGATSSDILELIDRVRDRVRKKYGINLELEQIPLLSKPRVKRD